MAFNSSNSYGQVYSFGFRSTDAPSISNFFTRSAELRYEPETFNEAKDSQGITMFFTSVINSKRKIIGSFTGYVSDGFDPYNDLFPMTFTFKGLPFTITNISHPMPKGNFHEVAIEAASYAYVTF